MKLLLILCWVLGVSADVLHEELHITGCTDFYGEDMYALDRDETWYADLSKGVGVMTLPDFVDPASYKEGTYEQAVANLQVCRFNLNLSRRGLKEFPLVKDPPSSPMIYNKDKVELGVKNVLICHVSGFYPAPVNVFWTKNGEKVTEGTSINVPYPNKDRSFTQISRLEFIPQQGDIYSCSVEHLALNQPLTRMWDVETTQPGVGPAVFCGIGLTIGLLGVAAGTFFLIKGNDCS
ncbi:HLA class II histocompatibility antigen, DR alpha chain-like [Acanthochromis polyacanthus]|uniref:HLA class II histocompatibility antigen, DR alpha chain-like n=1 Tax=Acanthochromis polyacanthus TaxID=80966 RepID=UPI002234C563|nr:HLA class II histocompatibility antigen, DR alpha chain-like [Acanthochromis polyacanthus]